MNEKRKKPKLIYVVTEDWYFYSHRLTHAKAALESGFDVYLLTNISRYKIRIESVGIKVIPLQINRKSFNPLKELRVVIDLFRIYKKEQPDIIHHVAMKPVLYGSLAGLLSNAPHIVNALSGLGYLFTSPSLKMAPLRGLLSIAFHFLLNRRQCRAIVQNPDDFNLLKTYVGISENRLSIICGAGVDLKVFKPQPFVVGIPLIILPARMLWDKGVGEFVKAASILKNKGIEARFALVGERDPANPTSISEQQLQTWKNAGIVEWWGRQENMLAAYAACRIVCLPSYREGLPKALLEAAASSRPIIATNVPGCREVVFPNQNGLLVPPRNAVELSQALHELIDDPDICMAYGKAGRNLAEHEFSVEKISNQFIQIYKAMLDKK